MSTSTLEREILKVVDASHWKATPEISMTILTLRRQDVRRSVKSKAPSDLALQEALRNLENRKLLNSQIKRDSHGQVVMTKTRSVVWEYRLTHVGERVQLKFLK